MAYNKKKLLRQLELHEDFRGRPYDDKDGKTIELDDGNVTIGIGRNLDANPLTHDEAEYLFWNDIKKTIDELNRYSWFISLSDVRQRVLIDMVFNIGIFGFFDEVTGFNKTIGHIKAGRFLLASKEMLNSKWAWQVGARSKRLSKMMETDMDDDYFMDEDNN